MKIPINLRSIGLVLNATAALTDNIYSWCLSALALVLMMLLGYQPPRQPTTSRRTLRAGGEERAREDGGTPRPPQHGDDAMLGNREKINELGRTLSHGVTEISQAAMMRAGSFGAAKPQLFEMAGQVVLSGAMVGAGFAANVEHKAPGDEITPEFAASQMRKAFCPEVLVFAALYGAFLFDEAVVTGRGEGVSCETRTSTSPEKLWMALEAWQKVFPDKTPENYLNRAIVEAAREAGENSTLPLAEFMKLRAMRGSSTIN